jgi:hypothetical protein
MGGGRRYRKREGKYCGRNGLIAMKRTQRELLGASDSGEWGTPVLTK